MFFKKGGQGDSLLQSQFTAYLVVAVRRKKKDIIQARIRRANKETDVDMEEYFFARSSTEASLEDLICDQPLSIEDMYFENEKLERALWKLTERDRYVLFAKVMAERSFEELAAEFGISYKGITSVYARAIRKLKKEMEDADK